MEVLLMLIESKSVWGKLEKREAAIPQVEAGIYGIAQLNSIDYGLLITRADGRNAILYSRAARPAL